MGGKNSKYDALNKIDSSEWRSVGSENGAEIVKSDKGYGEGEIRITSLDPKRTLQDQMEIYNYRKNQNNALVSCYGVQALKAQSTTMCGNQQNLKVLTERIPTRWPTHPPIIFPQSLYVLGQCFKGFNDLYNKTGPFQITPNMIGINNQRQIKVWLNENFAENHPVLEKPFLQTTSSQAYLSNSNTQRSMVRTIIDIVENKCEEGRYPPDFKDKIHRSSVSFSDAMEGIEQYAQSANIDVPEQINSKFHPNLHSLNQYETQPININNQQVALQSQRAIYKIESAPIHNQPLQSQPIHQHQLQRQPSNVSQTEIGLYQPHSKGQIEYSQRNIMHNEMSQPTNRYTLQSTVHKPNELPTSIHPLSPRGSKISFNYGSLSLKPKQF